MIFKNPPLPYNAKENKDYLPIMRRQLEAVADDSATVPSEASEWSVRFRDARKGIESRVIDTHTNRFLGDLAPDLTIVRGAAVPVPATVAAVVELHVCDQKEVY
jgi:hypothetical protein